MKVMKGCKCKEVVKKDFSEKMIFQLRCNAWKGPREEYNGEKESRCKGHEQRLRTW